MEHEKVFVVVREGFYVGEKEIVAAFKKEDAAREEVEGLNKGFSEKLYSCEEHVLIN